MASILTNASSMAALQTLRTISNNMESTQNRISTGQRVSTASDNAAYWSIATTMRSDNAALGSVSDALGLGAAKIDTAYAGMESAIKVVDQIKQKLVTAKESTADKAKIQAEITQLQDQLTSITSSASFSGENWLKGSIGKAGAAAADLAVGVSIDKQIVGSFTRDASGNVQTQAVDIKLDGTNVLVDSSGKNQGLLDKNATKATVAQWTDGKYYTATTTPPAAATASKVSDSVWTDGAATPKFFKEVEPNKFLEVTDATGTALAGTPTALTTTAAVFVTDTSVSKVDITKLSTIKTGLGLAATATDEDVLDSLISHVDGQLEGMNSAAAKLGALSSRISLQEDFVSKLSDTMEKGIGRLVDADMNEESTRLKALQTQQQLAIQALSIANSDSQNILSLFR
ncbi:MULTISPECIES: flagellin [Rhizobium/Agrobacterium group]|uniref:Flagellin n=1 Tax=Rhizobium rhizogenes TaxID=359 RepID=A0A546XIG8_RHIRH|nr:MULTISPECIES: flagellin [Rhizobium/Agrobacterium group]MCZ7479527.1 flagellin [Rhizobium rhizogenes]MDA5631920.1 flagellin [Agrobacterium sp. ST15.16.024]MDF1887783.1 flagellin [Rhizobium rhizogenes]MDO3440899.1 flagellin [Agrobacterium sp. V1]TRB00547.1 flagellin [Rhizobium rhizogenes]